MVLSRTSPCIKKSVLDRISATCQHITWAAEQKSAMLWDFSVKMEALIALHAPDLWVCANEFEQGSKMCEKREILLKDAVTR